MNKLSRGIDYLIAFLGLFFLISTLIGVIEYLLIVKSKPFNLIISILISSLIIIRFKVISLESKLKWTIFILGLFSNLIIGEYLFSR